MVDGPRRRGQRMPGRAVSRVRRALAIMVGLLLFAGLGLSALPASAGELVPVTISFTKLIQRGGDIDNLPTDGRIGDFYARASINGEPWQDTFEQRFGFGWEFGGGHISPPGAVAILTPPQSWTMTRMVDSELGSVPVSIEIWDDDDPLPDGQTDISPTESLTLSLTVDLADGRWSGDVSWPNSCPEGTGGWAVGLCFTVSTLSTTGDLDGDALFDGWEQHGYRGFAGGGIDVDLPALGADPRRKDLFVEIDCLVDDANGDGDTNDVVDHSHCPRQDSVIDVVTAFANAPVNNPDGSRGIELHVDVGALYGPGVIAVTGSGGAVGGVGGMGGGGDRIPEADNRVIDWDGAVGHPGVDLHSLKAAHFDAGRREDVFRYGIFGHQTNARADEDGVNDCTGGWAEGGKGNDFMVTLGGRRNVDGREGGDVPCGEPTPANAFDDDGDGRVDEDRWDNRDNDGDCLPGTDSNGDGLFCSTYDLGVDEDSGESLGSREMQAATFMHEFGHLLGLDHGGGDRVNNKPNYRSVMNYSFSGCNVPASPRSPIPSPGGCDYSRLAVDLDETSVDECLGLGALDPGRQNWNGNTTPTGIVIFDGDTCPPPNNMNLRNFDLNRDGRATDLLRGFDDWNNLFYNFQGLANLADDAAIEPVQDEPDPASVEDAMRRMNEVTEPRLQVSVTGPVSVLRGQHATYTVTATNTGRGPAWAASLAMTRPDGSTLTADLGRLDVGAGVTRTFTYLVPAHEQAGAVTARVVLSGTGTVGRTVSAEGTTTAQVINGAAPRWGFAYMNEGTAPIGVETTLVPSRQWTTGRLDPATAGRRASSVHTGTGEYLVRLPDVAANIGVAHVSPVRTIYRGRTCMVASYEPNGPDELIRVRCFDQTGAPVDWWFLLFFTAPTIGDAPDAPLATVLYDAPGGAGPMSPTGNAGSHNSTGLANHVFHDGPGRYRMLLEGEPFAAGAGYVQITSYGTGAPARCHTEGTRPVGQALEVTVACYAVSSSPVPQPADAQWVASYIQNAGLHHDTTAPAAYLTAMGDQAAPVVDPSRSWSANGETPTVTRLGVGHYRILYQSIGKPIDTALVTSSTPGRYCHVGTWGSYSRPPELLIDVYCHNAAGTRADSLFGVTYGRAP